MPLKSADGIGWDAGCLVAADPENLYKLHDWWMKNHGQLTQDGAFYEYIVLPTEESRAVLQRFGVVLLDNFGGDSMADFWIDRAPDGTIKQLVLEVFPIEEPENVKESSRHYKLPWQNGMIYLGDPVTFNTLFEEMPTYLDFKAKHHSHNFMLNDMLITDLPQKGIFNVWSYGDDPEPDGMDSVVVFDRQS